MKNKLGLYIHVPFCVRKCHYCDFLSGPADEKMMTKYCENLQKEMAIWSEDSRIQEKEVDTIFIGGGTPSILSPENIDKIQQGISKYFTLTKNPEFSIECNPGTVTKDKLNHYRKIGINRLSIGMQSTIDEELEKLGRIHTYKQFQQAFMMAREVGFDNINVDIMSAIPGQTVESYKTTLERVLKLKPEHISSYSLIIEEGTPFYERYKDKPPVDEDTDRKMYELTDMMLSKAGFSRYEISNYATKNYSCKHNLKYWKRSEYLGLGIGAASFLAEERFSNVRNHDEYERKILAGEKPLEITEKIDLDSAMAEFMYLGLRCMGGVSRIEFERYFQLKLMDVYGEVIKKMIKEELLEENEEFLCLTKRGIDISNYVFSEFI